MKIRISGVTNVLADIASKTKKLKEANTVKIAKELVDKLKKETPVDTGYARDHWELLKAGGQLSIENPTPYLNELNEGSSQQAPAHFVEIAVLSTPNVRANGVIVSNTP